jgi:hypothetical protein
MPVDQSAGGITKNTTDATNITDICDVTKYAIHTIVMSYSGTHYQRQCCLFKSSNNV